MHELVYCLLIMGVCSSFFYLTWWLLQKYLIKRDSFFEIYWSLHFSVVFLLLTAVLSVILSISISVYMDRNGGTILWSSQSPHMMLILKWIFRIWLLGAIFQVLSYGDTYSSRFLFPGAAGGYFAP